MKKILLLFIFLSLFCCEKPGKGKKAELGFRRSKTIILALSKYNNTHQSYPKSLSDLVPEFLTKEQLKPPLFPKQKFPFRYRIIKKEYTLSFRYYGPGMNICTYSSKSKKWQSHGYY